MANSNRKILFWFFACFILCVCGYLWGTLSQSYEYDMIVPVEFIDIPKGLIPVGKKIQNIEAHVSGPKSEIDQLSDQQLKYSLSMKDAKEGVTSFSIDPENIKKYLSKRLKVNSVTPSSVKVKMEKEGIRDLPVNLVFSGKPAPGYVLSESLVKPNMILIRGPKNVLEKLDKIDTKPIDLTGVSESFRKEISPHILEDVEILSTSKVVQADIHITEKIIEKQFDAVKIFGRDTKLSYEILPSKVHLTVKGPKKIIDKIDPEKDFNISVDLKGLKKGVYARPAEINLPVDIVLVNIKPEVFTVTMK